MVLSGLRIIVEALNSGVYGVNEQLERVPVDTGDAQPPPIVSVLDLTRDVEVLTLGVNGLGGIAPPALICAPEDPAVMAGEIEGAGIRRDGEAVSYSVAYATREPDLADACRNGLYTMRAIEQVIGHLMKTSNIADRTRNGVVLQSCVEISYGLVVENLTDGTVTAALSATFQPRNTNPLPA